MPAISKKIKIVIAAASALMTLLFSGFIFLIIVIMVLIGGSEMQVQQYQEDIPSIFSDSVLAYEDTVIRECIGQDIGEYSSVVLAMMQVISNGEGEYRIITPKSFKPSGTVKATLYDSDANALASIEYTPE